MDSSIGWEVETAKEMAKMRELVELAARRTSELHEAMARARAAGQAQAHLDTGSSTHSASLATHCDSTGASTSSSAMEAGGKIGGAPLSSVQAGGRTTVFRSSCRSPSPGDIAHPCRSAKPPSLNVCTPPPLSRAPLIGVCTEWGAGIRAIHATFGAASPAAARNFVVEGLPEKRERVCASPLRGHGSPSRGGAGSPSPPGKGLPLSGSSSVQSFARHPPVGSPAHAQILRNPIPRSSNTLFPVPAPLHAHTVGMTRAHSLQTLRPCAEVHRLSSNAAIQHPRSPSPPVAVISSVAMGLEGTKTTTGLSNSIRPLIEIVGGGRMYARARVYLYHAPFSPSVCFANGSEHFILPGGWAVLRSHQGLLVWLELLDDVGIGDMFLDITAASPAPSLPLAAPAVRGSCSPMPCMVGNVDTESTIALRLPAPAGGALGGVEIHQIRVCAVECMIRLPCEDMMVLHPRSIAACGLRALLGSGPGRTTFDCIFKAWLSSWEAQV